ncbi:MAG TPA: hypothetical protein VF940_04840 [Streptosporangiaceae bacterium]
MSTRSAAPPSAVAAVGLVGGFIAARRTGRRDVGGALFAAAGAWCAREWYRASGPVAMVGLSAFYAAAMGGSHPLAKKAGAWPSVVAVAAVAAAASELVTRIVPPRDPAIGR